MQSSIDVTIKMVLISQIQTPTEAIQIPNKRKLWIHFYILLCSVTRYFYKGLGTGMIENRSGFFSAAGTMQPVLHKLINTCISQRWK